MKPRIFATALLLGAAVIGSGNALARDEGDRCGNCGTVVAVSEVKNKDTHLGAGTAIGAVAGGILGNQVGKGDGRKAATVAGAVAGGAIGHSVEKNNRETRYAWRFSVDMDNGRRVTVTQNDNPDVRSGDRVRVFNGRLERF
jgi:outer membrane lipoprotein SlyB